MFFGSPKNIPDVFFTDAGRPFTDFHERPAPPAVTLPNTS